MSSIFRRAANGASPAFGFPSLSFGGQSFLSGGRGRFGWPSRPGFFSGLADQPDQAIDGVFAIAILAPMASGFNDQYAFGGHTTAGDLS